MPDVIGKFEVKVKIANLAAPSQLEEVSLQLVRAEDDAFFGFTRILVKNPNDGSGGTKELRAAYPRQENLVCLP